MSVVNAVFDATAQRGTAAPLQPPLLEVQGVHMSFGGIVALEDVSFSVQSGCICGLIGPNGAGKTTLFNCLSGLYRPQRGTLRFAGQSTLDLPRHHMAKLGIGRTFQNLALFGSMSVERNVLVGGYAAHGGGYLASMLGLLGARESERALRHDCKELLALLDLEDVAGERVSNLPFGTQKRVEFARALACRPRLLLLDEPAASLTHEEVEDLRALILKLQRTLGLTVLLVEHHMGLVMGVADQVVVLSFGRKIADGSAADVRSHPEVIRAYLGGDAHDAAA